MTKKTLTPFLTSMLWAQQTIITAMVVSRFNPAEFENILRIVRQTSNAAVAGEFKNPSDRKAAEKEFDQIVDLYLQMFRTGDLNAEGDNLVTSTPH